MSGVRPEALLFTGAMYQCFFSRKQALSPASEGADGDWVVVQLSEQNEIENAFCSCCQYSAVAPIPYEHPLAVSSGCIHVALSCLTIFSNREGILLKTQPIHKRFYSASLFHSLFCSLFQEPPLPVKSMKKKEQYQESDVSALLDASASGPRWTVSSRSQGRSCTVDLFDAGLIEYIDHVCGQLFSEELDDSSIKFSNSSDADIEKWRRGAPSSIVRYELSRASEIAKALFLYSEGAVLCGSTAPASEQMKLSIGDIADQKGWSFTLSAKNRFCLKADPLPEPYAFPALSSSAQLPSYIVSDRSVIDCRRALPQFCPSIGECDPAAQHEWALKEVKKCAEAPQGVLRSSSGGLLLFPCEPVEKEDCQSLIERFVYLGLMKAVCVDEVVQTVEVDQKPEALSVHTSILYKGKDLLKEPDCIFIGPWIIDQGGRQPRSRSKSNLSNPNLSKPNLLLHVRPSSMPMRSFSVPKADVPSFLIEHHKWLAMKPGFSLFPFSGAQEISFSIDRENHALFISRSEAASAAPIRGGKKIVFGSWEWRPGCGFFKKGEGGHGSSQLCSQVEKQLLNVPIPPHRVARIVAEHEAFFSCIPGFFAVENPVARVSLNVFYNAQERQVELGLLYAWKQAIYERSLIVYDDFGYIPQLGFFRMPTLPVQDSAVRVISSSDRTEWDRFFLEQLPRFQHEFHCVISPCLEPAGELKLYCDEVEVLSESIEQWAVGFVWRGARGSVFVEELLDGIACGTRFIPTAAGLVDVEGDRFLWLLPFVKHRPSERSGAPSGSKNLGSGHGALQVKSFDMLRIQAHDTLHFTEDGDGRTKELLRQLLSEKAGSVPDLRLLNSELRPYQKNGLDWLWFLYTSKLSGLLCDDMGVGKTHQALALLAAVQSQLEIDGRTGRFLIVCPTSLIWHWREKLERFIPSLKVLQYSGSDRRLDPASLDWNVFLTTYGIWRSDVELTHAIIFDVAVFDELQVAKNHISQIWSSLAQVRSRMRLGLTGTPIENQLRELKSLFDLVLPGYIPKDSIFREFYMRPIEREGEMSTKKALLARVVKPFVLRRKKEDVLPDLPAKTEEIFLTDLLPSQKALYHQVASMQGLPLIQQLQDDSSPIPYIHIFTLLSALKQIANHPACYLKDISEYKQYDSGKWLLFQELLEEALESGQKVVVFSQYLHMLDIIGLYLKEIGVHYSEIRGNTKFRGEAVEKFQNDPSCRVFLGSLQAAGLGIDLTAASSVIHYDRWWNAARENQATDRVHRLGQSQGVFVIKMVTRMTVEEHIDKMIARKACLLDEVINYDDHQIVKKMSRGELLELLALSGV